MSLLMTIQMLKIIIKAFMKTENIGWQCPNCLVVYAPSVEKCKCSVIPILTKDEFKITTQPFGTITTNTNTNIGNTPIYNRPNASDTTYICSGFISESPNGVCSRCGRAEWNHPIISHT